MKFFNRHFFGMFAFFLVVLTAGCSNSGAAGGVGGGPIADELRFTLSSPSGESVRLDDVLKNNKAVLVTFWATWCPPCREEIPDLIQLQERYGKDGFTVLGVDVGESAAKVSAFMGKTGINYPVVLDTQQTVAAKYRVVGIPTSLLMDSEGRIIGEYHSVSRGLEDAIKKAVSE